MQERARCRTKAIHFQILQTVVIDRRGRSDRNWCRTRAFFTFRSLCSWTFVRALLAVRSNFSVQFPNDSKIWIGKKERKWRRVRSDSAAVCMCVLADYRRRGIIFNSFFCRMCWNWHLFSFRVKQTSHPGWIERAHSVRCKTWAAVDCVLCVRSLGSAALFQGPLFRSDAHFAASLSPRSATVRSSSFIFHPQCSFVVDEKCMGDGNSCARTMTMPAASASVKKILKFRFVIIKPDKHVNFTHAQYVYVACARFKNNKL